MPSIGPYAQLQPQNEKSEDPVTVLVTGFGPFLEKYPRNSSWEIAKNLPALIPASTRTPTPIRIIVHHEPVRVSYHHVLDLVPRVLEPSHLGLPVPDVVLHIGLAASRKFFALEQGAHRLGYGVIPDVDGKRFPDDNAEAEFPAAKYPDVLKTSFETSDVLARWKGFLDYVSVDSNRKVAEMPDVQLSPDAGNFLCGFIYYNSLARWKAETNAERPIAFMHVPDLTGSESQLNDGLEVTIALIKALVESRREVGLKKTGQARGSESKSHNNSADLDNNFV